MLQSTVPVAWYQFRSIAYTSNTQKASRTDDYLSNWLYQVTQQVCHVPYSAPTKKRGRSCILKTTRREGDKNFFVRYRLDISVGLQQNL